MCSVLPPATFCPRRHPSHFSFARNSMKRSTDILTYEKVSQADLKPLWVVNFLRKEDSDAFVEACKSRGVIVKEEEYQLICLESNPGVTVFALWIIESYAKIEASRKSEPRPMFLNLLEYAPGNHGIIYGSVIAYIAKNTTSKLVRVMRLPLL